MPQETLEWSSTVASTFDATISRVENDDGNYAVAGSTGQSGTIDFGNMTASDIGTINWIRAYYKALATGVKQTIRVGTQFRDSSGGALGSADIVIVEGPSEQLYPGTTLYNDGASAWTESSVNDARLVVEFNAIISSGPTELWIDYIYVVVDYSEPVIPTPTYDSTVNNVHVLSGNIDITSGNIYL